jgi:hypothetical protein
LKCFAFAVPTCIVTNRFRYRLPWALAPRASKNGCFAKQKGKSQVRLCLISAAHLSCYAENYLSRFKAQLAAVPEKAFCPALAKLGEAQG